MSDNFSRFFNNKGAVAGVFLIVGLAAASIVLFLFFFIKRRRRTRRLEYDTAVASTLAAAGYNRTPLDGDDDDHRPMAQRRGSNVSAMQTMTSSNLVPYTDEPPVIATAAGMGGRERDFDPYAPYTAQSAANARRDGYARTETNSPPLVHSHSASTSSGHAMNLPRESAGSYEPLLAAGGMIGPSLPTTPSTMEAQNTLSPPTIPPRSPRRPPGTPSDEGGQGKNRATRDSASSMYSNDDELDDQLVDLIPRPLEVSRFLLEGFGGGTLY